MLTVLGLHASGLWCDQLLTFKGLLSHHLRDLGVHLIDQWMGLDSVRVWEGILVGWCSMHITHIDDVPGIHAIHVLL